jgi:hypothetical protein
MGASIFEALGRQARLNSGAIALCAAACSL